MNALPFANHKNEIERQICVALVEDALAAGFMVSVPSGEEWSLRHSRDPAAIFAAMSSTDMDTLHFKRDRTRCWVHLIYGNDCDVISGNSCPEGERDDFDREALSWRFMKRAEEIAERFRG